MNRSAKRPLTRRGGPARKSAKWSAEVTRTSDALRLEDNVFQQSNPRRIASSLKRSAEASRKRKSGPFQSAMSMLNFYINRAGRALPGRQRAILDRAKVELRNAFGKTPKKDKSR